VARHRAARAAKEAATNDASTDGVDERAAPKRDMRRAQ
jgi:hypothetical protein